MSRSGCRTKSPSTPPLELFYTPLAPGATLDRAVHECADSGPKKDRNRRPARNRARLETTHRGPFACPTAAAATPPQGALSSGPRQKKVGTNPCQVRISLHAERQLAHDPHQAQFCNPARHGWGLPGNRDRRGWAPSGPSRPPAGSRARRRRLTARARTGRSTSVPSAAPQQIQT